MNAVSFGQQYPVYANCFDRLTTNGILADDLVGYVTGAPSPYLQNYVAQRGLTASLPGQILPDTLPAVPPVGPISVNASSVGHTQSTNVPAYNDVPRVNSDTFTKKDEYSSLKKLAAGVLLSGLAAFGLYKGISLFRNGGAGFKTAMNNFFTSINTAVKKAFTSVGNFFKNLWNKIFHRNP